jgi:YidC/Oxa1 family membrane protein insertase
MDRNTILRWVLIAGLILLGYWLFFGKKSGSESGQKLPEEVYVNAPDFAPDAFEPQPQRAPDAPPFAEEKTCSIAGDRFDAELSTRGAALKHFWLRDPQYANIDMSTTPDHERWRNLRTLFRGPGADDQVKFDRFGWDVEQAPDKSACTFSYHDDQVAITKKVSRTSRPFELAVETTIKNLTKDPKKHRFSIGMYAFHTNEETRGKWGRVSPFQTELSCARGKEVVHKNREDFKEGPFEGGKVDRYGAVSNYYFAQALVPEDREPRCDLLAEYWYSGSQKPDDDEASTIYKATLTYDAQVLEGGAQTTYTQIAFLGPKERDVLDRAAGGKGLGDLINLGFFSPVAKVLVAALVFIKTHVTHNWGLSIILLTIGLRALLFPLTWKSIKSSLDMRKLKPELDEINRKFPDDLQAKNLAMMELWKKHGYGPLGPAGAGCLPQLVQMPVWFAMYTTLQTAVEMYHTRFLWFSDLSAADHLFILPLVLIALIVVQQRMVPQTPGMDPTQQKMMMWLMPILFGGMMLFLPAALGVYMMTNSLLGITQQFVLNRFFGPKQPPKKGEIVVKQSGSSAEMKGIKARV